mmetsp:Transcript_67961/g.196881  ORF Transcript_67961/g.196881 Transcript_67961/m.196881 type:complete len:417 (-) Transcript_67961:11-1261(-)
MRWRHLRRDRGPLGPKLRREPHDRGHADRHVRPGTPSDLRQRPHRRRHRPRVVDCPPAHAGHECRRRDQHHLHLHRRGGEPRVLGQMHGFDHGDELRGLLVGEGGGLLHDVRARRGADAGLGLALAVLAGFGARIDRDLGKKVYAGVRGLLERDGREALRGRDDGDVGDRRREGVLAQHPHRHRRRRLRGCALVRRLRLAQQLPPRAGAARRRRDVGELGRAVAHHGLVGSGRAARGHYGRRVGHVARQHPPRLVRLPIVLCVAGVSHERSRGGVRPRRRLRRPRRVGRGLLLVRRGALPRQCAVRGHGRELQRRPRSLRRPLAGSRAGVPSLVPAGSGCAARTRWFGDSADGGELFGLRARRLRQIGACEALSLLRLDGVALPRGFEVRRHRTRRRCLGVTPRAAVPFLFKGSNS